MSDPVLAAITERAAKATPGPWTRDYYYVVGQVPKGRPNGEVIGQMTPSVPRLLSLEQEQLNAEFVANSRADVDFLLARVGELEAENERLRNGWRPLPDGGLVASIPEHLFKCPPDCTDETPIVSVGWSTPDREVKPWDEDFDPASPFVQRKPDPDNNTTSATHASSLKHELPYDTRIGTGLEVRGD